MTATARLLAQRSTGQLDIHMERGGPVVLKETGSAKVRLPRGSVEAILINTSGGLAGGDRLAINAGAGEGAALTLTGQAAERIYRTLGPPALVDVALRAGPDARLAWLPQESIFFDGSALRRRIDVDLDEGARFIGLEAMVFGRHEMEETIRAIAVEDSWMVRRNGVPVHAERFRIVPRWPEGEAAFATARAAATLLVVSPEAEGLAARVRAMLSPEDGVSAWNGKMVARLLAGDGFHLRKRLIQVLGACVGSDGLPKTWTF